MGYGFDIITTIFPFMFISIFALCIGVFIFNAVKGLKTWKKNNNSPRLSVMAKVVAKRMNVSHHHHHNNATGAPHHTSSSTNYYVTFEVESGDRMEFHLLSNEYAMLVEGDYGKLTFQGTRYLSFERERY